MPSLSLLTRGMPSPGVGSDIPRKLVKIDCFTLEEVENLCLFSCKRKLCKGLHVDIFWVYSDLA